LIFQSETMKGGCNASRRASLRRPWAREIAWIAIHQPSSVFFACLVHESVHIRVHMWAERTRVFLCTKSKLRFWRDDERRRAPPPLLLSMKRKSYNTRESYRPTPGRKRPWLLKGRWCFPRPFACGLPRPQFIPKLCRDFVLSDSTGENIKGRRQADLSQNYSRLVLFASLCYSSERARWLIRLDARERWKMCGHAKSTMINAAWSVQKRVNAADRGFGD